MEDFLQNVHVCSTSTRNEAPWLFRPCGVSVFWSGCFTLVVHDPAVLFVMLTLLPGVRAGWLTRSDFALKIDGRCLAVAKHRLTPAWF